MRFGTSRGYDFLMQQLGELTKCRIYSLNFLFNYDNVQMDGAVAFFMAQICSNEHDEVERLGHGICAFLLGN